MRATLLTVSFALVATSVAFPNAPSDPNAVNAGCPFAAAEAKRQLVQTFDPVKQKVDVTGEHRFIPPRPTDQRGPCPGLNSMANHGYINRNGVTDFSQAVEASQKVFNMGLDTAIGVTCLGVIYGGNSITQRFSIDKPVPGLGALLDNPPGLHGTHNKFEGDASATRGDAHTNNGDASSLSLVHFKHLHDSVPKGGNFDVQAMIDHRAWTRNHSISTNPHFFAGPVPVVVVSTLTHLLTTRQFSNHSAEYPGGFLSHEVLKSFHGVSGDSGNLTFKRGHERIPDNWYKAPVPYTIPDIVVDLVNMMSQHPEFLSVGGNNGTVNSFAGVDLGNITGGAYNSATLLQGNNLICFLYQAMQSTVIGGGPNPAGVLDLLLTKFGPIVDSFACPEFTQYNTTAFDMFPGAKDN